MSADSDLANVPTELGTDRFSDGCLAARRFCGTGAVRALADIGAAAAAVQERHPDGPDFYTGPLDLMDSRTRKWAQLQ